MTQEEILVLKDKDKTDFIRENQTLTLRYSKETSKVPLPTNYFKDETDIVSIRVCKALLITCFFASSINLVIILFDRQTYFSRQNLQTIWAAARRIGTIGLEIYEEI